MGDGKMTMKQLIIKWKILESTFFSWNHSCFSHFVKAMNVKLEHSVLDMV